MVGQLNQCVYWTQKPWPVIAAEGGGQSVNLKTDKKE